MSLPLDPDTVSHGIQLAVAPVFLLTAVAGMIGVVATRLARIIDRARVVEARMKNNLTTEERASDQKELGELRSRGLMANGSIGLQTLCAFLIGATIMLLFLGEAIELRVLRLPMITFLSGVASFMLALGCFMAETLIATRLLHFGKHRR